MTHTDENQMAKVLTKYIVDNNIDPDTIDHIKMTDTGFHGMNMLLILKPLVSMKYIFDVSSNL